MTRTLRLITVARMRQAQNAVDWFEAYAHMWAVRHGITLLRLSMGAIFLGFGVLKFFPHVSPAQDVATATLSRLTLHLVPPDVGIVLIGSLESLIGLGLITGRNMRMTIWLLGFELIGILSPLVLLPGRLFTGPHHAPNIVGQYVLKDVMLAAAVVVLAATLRGGHLVSGPQKPSSEAPPVPDSHTFALETLVLAPDGEVADAYQQEPVVA